MTWPRNYHPLDGDGAPDTSVTVQLHPHEPGQTDALAQWCEVNGAPTKRLFINGGPALVLVGDLPIPMCLVGLGDIVARPVDGGPMFAIPGNGLGAYQPVDH